MLPDQVSAFDFELVPEGKLGGLWWLLVIPAALGAVLIGSGALEKD